MTIRAICAALLLAPVVYSQAPSFARDGAPVFAAKCTGCHAAGVKLGRLVLDDYEAVMCGGAPAGRFILVRSLEGCVL